MDQDGAVSPVAGAAGFAQAGEFIFQRFDGFEKIILEIVHAAGRGQAPGLLILIRGQELPVVHGPGKAIFQDLDRRDEVQAQQSEVGEIIIIQRLMIEVRVDEAKAREAVASTPVRAEIGQVDGARVAHEDVFNVAAAVKQDADLALDLGGEFGQGAGKLGADDALRGRLARGQLLQALERGGAESVRVAYEANGRSPGMQRAGEACEAIPGAWCIS